jgi:hypothetical protein
VPLRLNEEPTFPGEFPVPENSCCNRLHSTAGSAESSATEAAEVADNTGEVAREATLEATREGANEAPLDLVFTTLLKPN